MHATETHHRVPRHLLSAYDEMMAHPALDGEGIELALGFLELAMRFGIGDAETLTREELVARIEASRVELSREEHRMVHASDWREWGSRGGKATLARYGRGWFSYLAHKRWGRITAVELAHARGRLRSTRGVAA